MLSTAGTISFLQISLCSLQVKTNSPEECCKVVTLTTPTALAIWLQIHVIPMIHTATVMWLLLIRAIPMIHTARAIIARSHVILMILPNPAKFLMSMTMMMTNFVAHNVMQYVVSD